MPGRDRIVLLGTKGGPALRRGGAMPCASLLQLDGENIVVDCGLGVTKALVEAGVDLRALTTICITHLHSDHILELGPLIHTAWCTGLRGPVTIYGPKGIEGVWQGFLASMSVDLAIRVEDEGRTPLPDLVRVVTFGAGVVRDDGVRIAALEVPHPPLPDCFALRFDGTRRVTFSGDCTYHPPLAGFAAGCDVLVHEALLPMGVDLLVQKAGLGDKLRDHLLAAHTKAEDVGRIAQAAGVGHLVLTHLVPSDDDRVTEAHWREALGQTWNGALTLGHDGLEIAL
jgi:ribonuclease BN (tRNA processing enzyme)